MNIIKVLYRRNAMVAGLAHNKDEPFRIFPKGLRLTIFGHGAIDVAPRSRGSSPQPVSSAIYAGDDHWAFIKIARP